MGGVSARVSALERLFRIRVQHGRVPFLITLCLLFLLRRRGRRAMESIDYYTVKLQPIAGNSLRGYSYTQPTNIPPRTNHCSDNGLLRKEWSGDVHLQQRLKTMARYNLHSVAILCPAPGPAAGPAAPVQSSGGIIYQGTLIFNGYDYYLWCDWIKQLDQKKNVLFKILQ